MASAKLSLRKLLLQRSPMKFSLLNPVSFLLTCLMHLIPPDTASQKLTLTWFPWHCIHYPSLPNIIFLSPSLFPCLQPHERECSRMSVLSSLTFFLFSLPLKEIIHFCSSITYTLIPLKPLFLIPSGTHIFQILHWPFLCVSHTSISNSVFWEPNSPPTLHLLHMNFLSTFLSALETPYIPNIHNHKCGVKSHLISYSIFSF